MRTSVCGGGVRCVRGVCRRLPPRSLQAVVLLGQLLYGLLQVSTLLSLMLQHSLPSAAVALGQLQEITACLTPRHTNSRQFTKTILSFNPNPKLSTPWSSLCVRFLSHNSILCPPGSQSRTGKGAYDMFFPLRGAKTLQLCPVSHVTLDNQPMETHKPRLFADKSQSPWKRSKSSARHTHLTTAHDLRISISALIYFKSQIITLWHGKTLRHVLTFYDTLTPYETLWPWDVLILYNALHF